MTSSASIDQELVRLFIKNPQKLGESAHNRFATCIALMLRQELNKSFGAEAFGLKEPLRFFEGDKFDFEIEARENPLKCNVIIDEPEKKYKLNVLKRGDEDELFQLTIDFSKADDETAEFVQLNSEKISKELVRKILPKKELTPNPIPPFNPPSRSFQPPSFPSRPGHPDIDPPEIFDEWNTPRPFVPPSARYDPLDPFDIRPERGPFPDLGGEHVGPNSRIFRGPRRPMFPPFPNGPYGPFGPFGPGGNGPFGRGL